RTAPPPRSPRSNSSSRRPPARAAISTSLTVASWAWATCLTNSRSLRSSAKPASPPPPAPPARDARRAPPLDEGVADGRPAPPRLTGRGHGMGQLGGRATQLLAASAQVVGEQRTHGRHGRRGPRGGGQRRG